jgi:hypothetical protein
MALLGEACPDRLVSESEVRKLHERAGAFSRAGVRAGG